MKSFIQIMQGQILLPAPSCQGRDGASGNIRLLSRLDYSGPIQAGPFCRNRITSSGKSENIPSTESRSIQNLSSASGDVNPGGKSSLRNV